MVAFISRVDTAADNGLTLKSPALKSPCDAPQLRNSENGTSLPTNRAFAIFPEHVVESFGHQCLPVAIFMQIAGIPDEDRIMLRDWGEMVMRGDTEEELAEGREKLAG